MKSKKRRVFFIVAGLCLILIVSYLVYLNRADPVDEMHQELTEKYGEQVKTTIQALENQGNEQFNSREWEVVGTRVLEYTPEQEFKAIGCVNMPFEENTADDNVVAVILYLFRFGTWQIAAQMNLDFFSPYWNSSFTYRD